MDAGRVIADGEPQAVMSDPEGDRGLSRRRRGMTLLAVERLEARHGLLQAVRGVELADRAGRDDRARRRQRRRQDDDAAHDRRRAPARRAVASCSRAATSSGTAAHLRAAMGIALVPEGRRLFTRLTVEENLQLARSAGRAGAWTIDAVMEAFPNLKAAAAEPRRVALRRRTAGDGDRPRADDESRACCSSTRCRSASRRSWSIASTPDSRS